MSYEICVDCYEGPMDLLLDLVSKKKIDIYDISISQITKQYMDTISELNEMNMDIASDFIYMASRLLEIKSKYMLYVGLEEDMEDPRVDLYESIKEYAKFKNAALELNESLMKAPSRYFRPSIEIYYEDVIDLSKISLDDIIKSFPKFKPQEKEIKRDFTRRIISIEDKINEIKSILREKTSFYFDEIAGEIIKEEKIASMLGILELAKAKEAYLTQSDHLERIHIERWKDIG